MPRMTKAQREAENLLIDFAKAKQEVKDAERERDRLQKLVEALAPGQYGGWVKAYGEPRQIVDQAAVREIFEEINRPLPYTFSKAPLQVTEVK